MSVAENIAAVRGRIATAAAKSGRAPEEIRIVAAAKRQPIGKIVEAVSTGVVLIGHNYVQEAERCLEQLEGVRVEMRMIGGLQRNKAGKAARVFSVVETVDNAALAAALDGRAQKEGKVIEALIQVNLSGEPQKSGLAADQVRELVETVRALPGLRLKGLMTMPPFFEDPERARPYFAALAELRDTLIASGALADHMTELSMGMSGDFETAIEEGATLVRIGTALFGPRE